MYAVEVKKQIRVQTLDFDAGRMEILKSLVYFSYIFLTYLIICRMSRDFENLS